MSHQMLSAIGTGHVEDAAHPRLRRDHVVERDAQAGDHAQGRAPLVGAPPEDAQHQRREERRRRERERRRHQEQDVGRLLARHRTPRPAPPPAAGPWRCVTRLLRGRMRIDHLVVEVVRQRVGDGQQQAVRGRQRRGQTAGRHQARDHVRQARDLRRRQHHDVAADRDLGQLHDAVLVDVGDRQQRRIDPLPRRHPRRQLGELRADQQRVDVELHQHRQRRRGEIEQEDEEQRPGHRLPRFLHRRRGVVAHQDVRQRGRAHHQAEHQREEVLAR